MIQRMPTPTTYELSDGVATITMDDGKVNALSSAMLADVARQFDQAQADEAVVVLTGNYKVFSAGFDLRCELEHWPEMLTAGASLAERLLSFPRPVVVACTGAAVAMGGFLLLSADHRIGVEGDYGIGLNEVAIGLTLPWFGIELARHRLTRPYFDRCTVTGVILKPDEAQGAGFLDEIVPAADLLASATSTARALAGLDPAAHAATKLRVRARVLAGVRDGIERIADPDREL
jgi:enoyl-CoA hydratase/carnithine racemase